MLRQCCTLQRLYNRPSPSYSIAQSRSESLGSCVTKNSLINLQIWQDGYFQRTSLTALGLVVQLNHRDGNCPVPISIHDPFVVVDMNGVHALKLRYCGCSKSHNLQRYQQLLREAWYPASFHRPRTAFTFDMLDTYHKLTLQGKLNLYDFYHGILHKTDNCGRLKKIVSDLCSIYFLISCWYAVQIPRTFAMCPSMAPPQTPETGWQRTSFIRGGLNSIWIARRRMPSMPSPRS